MINVQLTAQDWVDANKLHMRWTTEAWLTRGLGVAILGAAGGLLFANDSLPELLQVVGGLLMIVFPLSYWLTTPLIGYVFMPWRARKLFAQTKAASAPFSVTWDEDIISFESAQWKQRSKWTEFLKWRENEALFLLYINIQSYRIIPKRSFNDISAAESFGRLVKEKVLEKQN